MSCAIKDCTFYAGCALCQCSLWVQLSTLCLNFYYSLFTMQLFTFVTRLMTCVQLRLDRLEASRLIIISSDWEAFLLLGIILPVYLCFACFHDHHLSSSYCLCRCLTYYFSLSLRIFFISSYFQLLIAMRYPTIFFLRIAYAEAWSLFFASYCVSFSSYV